VLRYVWLVPVYTFEATQAATSFDIRIQPSAIDGKDDLAKGTGGDWRYLYTIQDSRQLRKMVEVKLLRSGSAVSSGSVSSVVGPGWYVL
jgi:histone deacetylase HOS3